MNKKVLFCACTLLCMLGTFPSVLKAGYVYPLKIFTGNGSDSADIVLYVELFDAGTGQVDFVFHNDSLVNSSIAQIYLDDGEFLDISDITNGPGVSFSEGATPHNLPAGNTLTPSFVTTAGFSIGSGPPPPKNGVNPGEWVKITFDITNGHTFSEILGQMDNSTIRIGAHLIALSDGSSESAVSVPEPATVAMLVLSILSLKRIRLNRI